MPTIEATFTDPDAIRIDRPDGTWFLLGTEHADGAAIDSVTATGEGRHFCRSHPEALVVFIATSDQTANRVQAWKGVFSTREVFFSIRPSLDVSLSDHFLNVLASLPPRDRLPDEKALVGHYLFRKPFGRRTYSASITRLSHADHLEIELGTGKVRWSRFDRIEADTERRSSQEYVAAIDTALERSFESIPTDHTAALMFSGGVDSTLLMTYAGDSIQPITFVPDTPEFQPETRYARDAMSLFGSESREIPIAEDRFVEMLEISTDTLGTPVFDDSTPYFSEVVMNQPHGTFIAGQGADSGFGMSLKLARFSSWFRFPGLRHALVATAPHTPGHLGYRMRQVAPQAAGFARDPSDPDGFAGNTRSFGDTSLFQSVVGPSAITEVKAEQLEYVIERVQRVADPDSAFLSHIELAHWMVLFGNPILSMRLAAHARGRRAVGPYLDGRVLSELARVPIDERYVRGLRAKWMLKDLLDQRLPGYPTNQRKKHSALPYERFYEQGPLTGIWDRYDVPDIFSGKKRDALVAAPSTSTWNAITYAIWEQRVAKNPDLQGHTPHLAASFSIGVV